MLIINTKFQAPSGATEVVGPTRYWLGAALLEAGRTRTIGHRCFLLLSMLFCGVNSVSLHNTYTNKSRFVSILSSEAEVSSPGREIMEIWPDGSVAAWEFGISTIFKIQGQSP